MSLGSEEILYVGYTLKDIEKLYMYVLQYPTKLL